MEKIGSLEFFNNVSLNLNFNFNDLMESFKKTTQGVKDEFLDENNTLKLNIIDNYVKEYVNKKIREKYGENYSLDLMDDTMNISWDIKVESIKLHKYYSEDWWNQEESKPLKLPKLKKLTIEDQLANPDLIQDHGEAMKNK